MLYTPEQIAAAAKDATFYVTPEGDWLRIQYTELAGSYFLALDENTGEEYRIYFDEIAEDHDPEFHHLVRTQIA